MLPIIAFKEPIGELRKFDGNAMWTFWELGENTKIQKTQNCLEFEFGIIPKIKLELEALLMVKKIWASFKTDGSLFFEISIS